MPDPVALTPGEIPPEVLDDWMPILRNFAQVWNDDPRAVWTSFAMIIVSTDCAKLSATPDHCMLCSCSICPTFPVLSAL